MKMNAVKKLFAAAALSLCVLLAAAAPAAKQPPKAPAKPVAVKKAPAKPAPKTPVKPVPKAPPKPPPKPNYKKSVFFIRGTNGGGSAFMIRYKNKPCLVTVPQVILCAGKNVKISDIDGRGYEFEECLFPAGKDIVLIPLKTKIPAGIPVLNIHRSPGDMPDGAPVTAYGDSLGNGVIAGAKGKAVGVGPGAIEVNAPFTAQGSGGPVVFDASGLAAGTACYESRIAQVPLAAGGTRFSDAAAYTAAVKHFAVRLDGITDRDMQVLTPAQTAEDSLRLAPLLEIYNKIFDLIAGRVKPAVFKSELGAFCESRSLAGLDKYEWHTAAGREKHSEYSGMVEKVFKSLNMDDELVFLKKTDGIKEVEKLWDGKPDGAVRKKLPAPGSKCPYCNGMKYTVVRVSGGRRKNPCKNCAATGLVYISEPRAVYNLSGSFIKEASALIRPDERPVTEIKLGADAVESYGRDPYYTGMNILGHAQAPFGKIVRYKGNRILKTALETRITTIGRKVVRVTIIVPLTSDASIAEWDSYIEKDFGNLQHYTVDLRPLKKIENAAQKMKLPQSELEVDPFSVYCGVRDPDTAAIDCVHEFYSFMLYLASKRKTSLSL